MASLHLPSVDILAIGEKDNVTKQDIYGGALISADESQLCISLAVLKEA